MSEISGMIQHFLEGNIKTLSAEPVIESKTISENGTYTAPEGVDGYSPVVVNVPAPQPIIESKSITENGTYTAPEGVDGYSPVIVDVPLPQNAYLLKSVANLPLAIASFNDGQDMVMPSLKVAIEPQQDLHGYDSPWVGGAGKNKLKYPYYLSSTSINGVTFTVRDDGTVNVNGTATADASFYLAYTGSDMVLPQGGYTLNGCPSGGSNTTYMLNITNVSTQDIGSGANFTSDGTTSLNIRIIVRANTTASNLLFKPMIRLASVTDATYAPYSNICPISGWDEVDVRVADDVETPTVSNVYTIDLDGTRYGGEVDVVNGIVTPAPYYASYNGETLTGEWISDRDKYEVGATPTIGAQVVNIGASGTPVSILPTAVKSLRGVNNVYANTGNINDAEYFSKSISNTN